ncbi:hypothetical protein SAMN05444339_101932 [Loktanella atrilutea]|uniref:Uncharacterized protein n=1 Tax=Loktanella atrilutea TaxID=366533 RepID=A0A1M4V3D5_LOKAT|nr:hypothetical protein [Loktanella atrilutea]SHE63410.1 hypothetical protein SAMN05444339_101932 [Loktanella atrilutea]
MAERKRSTDGGSETEALIGNPPAAPDQSGTAGGALAERVASRDSEKRVTESPDSHTDATKSDKIATNQDVRND